ncbi:MAG: carboxypeptidase regulatory-like domain-containing protein [Saprospiraceae bacterium]|nr:carboxypeptidase regulatory-like domain-containing protein [Saprospiraceae bacterium]
MKKHVFYFDFLKMQAMKRMKIWLAMVGLVCAVGVQGQGWVKISGGVGGQGGNSIVSGYWQVGTSTADGGIMVVASNHIDSIPGKGLYLLKTDINGNTLIEKKFNEQFYCTPTDVELLPDGGFIVSGVFGYSPSLIKFNADLDTVWAKYYGFNVWYPYGSITTPDGGFALTGQISDSNGTNYKRVFLKKTDSEGNLIWEKEFEPPLGFKEAWGQDILLTPENEYVILGLARDSIYARAAILMKTDSLGQLIWQKEYKELNASEQSSNNIILSPDGGYVFGGRVPTFDSIACTKVNADGEAIWQNQWKATSQNKLSDIISADYGGYYLMHDFEDIELIKIDEAGNEMWQKSIDFGDDYLQGTNFIQSENGNIVVCGWANKNMGDVLLIKTDSLGNIYTSALTGTVHQDPESDCLLDPTESGFSGWLVQAEGTLSFATLTDSLGHYLLPLDIGSYTVTVTPPGPYWEVCNSPFQVDVTEFYDTLSLDFPPPKPSPTART